MQFHLIDKIVDCQQGKHLTAMKNLTLGEEYLGDHFPGFPVMPGVLMLQTVVEAASWLLRITEDYRFSIIALREVKNVKYGSFMEPGRTMKVHVEVQELGASEAVFKGRGECDGASTVSGRIVLARYNLSDRSPEMKDLDRDIIDGLQRRHRILTIGGMKG